jgi:hypothetical protein
MPFPKDQKIIDLMMSMPTDNTNVYARFRPLLRD